MCSCRRYFILTNFGSFSLNLTISILDLMAVLLDPFQGMEARRNST